LVKPGCYLFRASLTGLVFLLILGVIFLGAQAKASQYQPQKGLNSFLSQSTKMADSRVQRGMAIPPAGAVLTYGDDLWADFTPLFEQASLPRHSVFLDAFRFRPPPLT
jgi:hypothetical protein